MTIEMIVSLRFCTLPFLKLKHTDIFYNKWLYFKQFSKKDWIIWKSRSGALQIYMEQLPVDFLIYQINVQQLPHISALFLIWFIVFLKVYMQRKQDTYYKNNDNISWGVIFIFCWYSPSKYCNILKVLHIIFLPEKYLLEIENSTLSIF